MKLIVQKSEESSPRTFTVGPKFITVFGGVFLFSSALFGSAGFFAVQQWGEPLFEKHVATMWKQRLQDTRTEFKEASEQADMQLSALTMRVGDLQSQLLRINALGERLVAVAGIDTEEFDFSNAVAMGGPAPMEDELLPAADAGTLKAELDALAATLASREQQLSILERLLDGKELAARTNVAGHPVHKGYLSSAFGQRKDPFTGRITYHKGVDFAAPTGTEVLATGGGVVTFAGVKNGYGTTVDINHGNGISTRYGHLRTIEIDRKSVVAAGDVIATVGSTGRSTGPHVHYEVIKNGQQINPTAYLAKQRP